MYEPIVERSVVQQLDDLPLDSVVIDAEGDAWQKRAEGNWCLAAAGVELSDTETVASNGPLVLVYNPDHPR